MKTQLTIQEAREDAIHLIAVEVSTVEDEKYIKNVYEQYPDDSVVSNLYFYYMARKQYDNYKETKNTYYLDGAKSYAKHIESDYSGDFSEQVHSFMDELLGDNVDNAREDVVDKFRNKADILGTTKYIEDIYKKYPDDSTISNIYFYCIAKEQYEYYLTLDNTSYLECAEEFAANIDPSYSGEFSEEIQLFANMLLGDRESSYPVQKETTDRYHDLSNSEKKEICDYIQSRYEYYDSLAGSYSGDNYTDVIWEEASKKYGLTESQLDVIWMNMYDY